MTHYLDSFSPENMDSVVCIVEYYAYDEEGNINGTATDTLEFHVWPRTGNYLIEELICDELGIDSEEIIYWERK